MPTYPLKPQKGMDNVTVAQRATWSGACLAWGRLGFGPSVCPIEVGIWDVPGLGLDCFSGVGFRVRGLGFRNRGFCA